VRHCVDFDRPDRVPRDLATLPATFAAFGEETVRAFRERWPTDIVQCFAGRRRKPVLVRGDPHAVGQCRDEWGCVFENLQAGYMGEVKAPLLSDWSRLEDLHVPAELLDVDADVVNGFCRQEEHFVFASGWPRPFERIQFLRGSENVYLDLAEGSAELKRLIGIVHDFFVRQCEIWARTNVDALVIMDDWGAQRSLLVRPSMWRELFKPLYADYARVAHEHGKKMFMHSDGHITDILDDLIEIGIDAINAQLFVMDIEELGRRFRGRITFWGGMCVQRVLSRGTTADAAAAVRRVVENLWLPEGGAIAQMPLYPTVPLENAETVFRTWDELTSPPAAEVPGQT